MRSRSQCKTSGVTLCARTVIAAGFAYGQARIFGPQAGKDIMMHTGLTRCE